MSEWFYQDKNGKGSAAVTAQQLRELHQSRHINAETLIWREGMTKWQPLGELADELNMPVAAREFRVIQQRHERETQQEIQEYVQEQNKIYSRIIYIFIISLGIPIIIGIIYFAYSQIKHRQFLARMDTSHHLTDINSSVAGYFIFYKICPTNGSNLEQWNKIQPGSLKGSASMVKSTNYFSTEDGRCGFEATLHAPFYRTYHGMVIRNEYDPVTQQWQCTPVITDGIFHSYCSHHGGTISYYEGRRKEYKIGEENSNTSY